MDGFARRLILTVIFALLLLALSGCRTDSPQVLGQAYVAPATLNLRSQLTQKNSTVAVLKHGDEVGIVDARRRFLKIRTANGVEGWVDSSELLSPDEMSRIRRERDEALLLPSEGSATPYEPLNIHIDGNRKSPAFAQIPEGAPVTVLAHRLAPKLSTSPKEPPLIGDRPKPAARKPRNPRQARTTSRLPPPPAPPKPPANWQELSAERIDRNDSTADLKAKRDEQLAAKEAADLKKPVILENWTLVRTQNNQVGWVLSRNLMMSIPDEVAQYAEGKRITSYFSLGDVNDDEKGPKHNWLWTTSSAETPYDFDSWRVFLWNRRRHRYETSYRQRDIEGYFPVHVDSPDSGALGRTFELITKDDDGVYRKRAYAFDGVRVHLTGTENYNPAKKPETQSAANSSTAKADNGTRSSWLARHWKALRERILGSGI